MGAFSRDKGKRGEREIASIIAALTGWEVKRRVRQRDGDSDLEGVPGWSVEVKNCATLSINAWWDQACSQANMDIPVLFYKVPRKGWRAMWPIALFLTEQRADMWEAPDYAADTSVAAWACVAREFHSHSQLIAQAQSEYRQKMGVACNA